MHSCKTKSKLLDTTISQNEHRYFTLKPQMGKPTIKWLLSIYLTIAVGYIASRGSMDHSTIHSINHLIHSLLSAKKILWVKLQEDIGRNGVMGRSCILVLSFPIPWLFFPMLLFFSHLPFFLPFISFNPY